MFVVVYPNPNSGKFRVEIYKGKWTKVFENIDKVCVDGGCFTVEDEVGVEIRIFEARTVAKMRESVGKYQEIDAIYIDVA